MWQNSIIFVTYFVTSKAASAVESNVRNVFDYRIVKTPSIRQYLGGADPLSFCPVPARSNFVDLSGRAMSQKLIVVMVYCHNDHVARILLASAIDSTRCFSELVV